MSRQLDPEEKAALESLVDSRSLANVLRTLSDICFEKASHVESTWQDNELTKRWNRAARSVDQCANSVNVGGVS